MFPAHPDIPAIFISWCSNAAVAAATAPSLIQATSPSPSSNLSHLSSTFYSTLRILAHCVVKLIVTLIQQIYSTYSDFVSSEEFQSFYQNTDLISTVDIVRTSSSLLNLKASLGTVSKVGKGSSVCPADLRDLTIVSMELSWQSP